METKEKNWEDVFANRSQGTEQGSQKFRQNYLHQVYIYTYIHRRRIATKNKNKQQQQQQQQQQKQRRNRY